MIRNPILPGFNPDPCICQERRRLLPRSFHFRVVPGNPGLSFQRLKELGIIYPRTDR